jgi:hypothetical protein
VNTIDPSFAHTVACGDDNNANWTIYSDTDWDLLRTCSLTLTDAAHDCINRNGSKATFGAGLQFQFFSDFFLELMLSG